MGVWMQQQECLPDLVLCSSARRTRETFDRLCIGLGETPDLEIDESLYDATPSRMLASIARTPGRVSSLLVIAHNPGTEDLVRLIAPKGDAGALERAAAGMGTAHLADITLEAPKWAEVAPGAGRLERLVRPKELV